MQHAARGDDYASHIAQLYQDIVDGGKILLHHKILDSFGHVSARHPFHPDRFLLPRRVAPGLTRVEDIREFGLDGELVEDDGAPTFLERYIHSGVYAARPDVQAVIHSHSPAIITFGVLKDVPLRAVCHTGRFLGTAVPVFEIRDVAGPSSNMLIVNEGLGRALANSLGHAHVVLMRGHGSTVVGTSVQQAVMRAIYTEANASILAAALPLGEVNYLTEGEAATYDDVTAFSIERTWNFWKSEIAGG